MIRIRWVFFVFAADIPIVSKAVPHRHESFGFQKFISFSWTITRIYYSIVSTMELNDSD